MSFFAAGTAAAQPVPLVDVGRGPVQVTPGKVLVRAEPFADGLVRSWAQTQVRLVAANGADDTEAVVAFQARTIEEDVASYYERRVDLPRGSRKDVALTYLPGLGGTTRVVTVQAARQALQVEFPVELLRDQDVGIAVVGTETLGVNAVIEAWEGPVPGRRVRPREEAPRHVRMGLVPLEALPETVAPWQGIDWVVWPNPDPARLEPAELDALMAFVADGGHLFLTVTDGWRAVADSPLAGMLPVTLQGVADTEGLGALVGALRGQSGDPVTAPVGVATLSDDPAKGALALARVQVGEGSTPVWSAGTWGLGTVHVLLADPALEPLTRDIDRETLWRTLLWLPPPGASDGWVWRSPDRDWSEMAWSIGGNGLFFPGYSEYDSSWRRLLAALDLAAPSASDFYVAGESHYTLNLGWYDGDPSFQWEGQVREYLSEIPGVAPLPLSWLVVFAGLYLLVIGPVDFFVLRALKRQAWTWVTFPITIVVFSTVALVGTSLVKGNQAVLTRIEVVDVLPGTEVDGSSWWRGDTYLGVWATRKTSLSLRPGFPGGQVEPLQDAGAMWDTVLRTTEGGSELAWRAETWTLGYARTSWTAPHPGKVRVEVVPDGWRVTNDLGVDLVRAHLAARGRLLPLGALPDGASTVVRGDTAGGLAALEDLAFSRGSDPTYDDVLSLQWAERTLLEHPEVGRGHLDLSGSVAFVGTTDEPFEPLDLSGLNPVTRSVTVFRVPLAPGTGGTP